MFRRVFIAGAFIGPARAQDRHLRMIVPFPPGGATDIFARRLALRMQTPLGQPVVVENLEGLSSLLGTLEVVRARPDGQTVLFGTASSLGLYPLVTDRPLFDPLNDLAPVSLVGATTVAFAARPDVAADLPGLVAAARARPGQLRYGSPGTGTYLHLAMELLKREAGGFDLVHQPFAGSAAAMSALLGGSIEAISDSLSTALDSHRTGRIRILAVASTRRSLLVPEVPTVAEALNLPGFEAAVWMALMVPVGVPDSMRDRLAYAINTTLADGNMRAALEQTGFEPGGLLSPREIPAFLRAEQARWRPLVQATGGAGRLISGQRRSPACRADWRRRTAAHRARSARR